MNHAALSSPVFPPDPAAVRSARHWAAEHAAVDETGKDTVSLLVSELAANAVMHGRTPFRVTLDRVEDHIRVAVSDQGQESVPQVTTRDPEAITGRGLQVVAALASTWGVEGGPRPPTTVWFTLPAG